MQEVLESEYDRLQAEEEELVAEEAALDGQLAEYDKLLSLVEGNSGEFSQIVDNWTRVKKDAADCRKDLRRLGWTGD